MLDIFAYDISNDKYCRKKYWLCGLLLKDLHQSRVYATLIEQLTPLLLSEQQKQSSSSFISKCYYLCSFSSELS